MKLDLYSSGRFGSTLDDAETFRPLNNPPNPLLMLARLEGVERTLDEIVIRGLGLTGARIGDMKVTTASFRHARRVLNRLHTFGERP